MEKLVFKIELYGLKTEHSETLVALNPYKDGDEIGTTKYNQCNISLIMK